MLLYYFATNVFPYSVAESEQRWADWMGWIVGAAPVLLGVTLGALHAVCTKKGSIKQVVHTVLKYSYILIACNFRL